MKVLIISDTHRQNQNFLKVLESEEDIDIIIHCGDVEGSEYLYEEAADGNVYMVAGNNDFFSPLNDEEEFEIGNYKILLTHGHTYRISMGNELLKSEALSRGANMVIYGHTHRPVIEDDGRIIAINPGSLTYPRQDGHVPTYIVMTVDEEGNATFKLKFVR